MFWQNYRISRRGCVASRSAAQTEQKPASEGRPANCHFFPDV
jgi:hypothetical protein